MPRLATFALIFASFASPLAAAQKTLAASLPTEKAISAASSTDFTSFSRLPVKRVVLYKNGIGYFEHMARVRGSQDLAIDFTTGQLNDVLKSLTVVDLGEGRIGSVRYNSIAPLDERLRSLRLPFGEQVSHAEFLTALRGARVEVRNANASASGRLLSVEKERRQNGKGDFADVTTFSIVTDSGEMRNFELGPGTSVRLAEHDLSEEVGRYLNLVGSSRARDLRRMTISALGTGERSVFVSYISEVPVWKSTYRIILPDKPGEKPLLQGWAIVDNTVGEDWKDVQLSLVAGAPQSFIQDISQPFYTRRPVVEPPESMMLTPQTHEATMSAPTALVPSFSVGTGGLQGTVKDPSGAFVAGAQVTVRNEETGASQSTTSDANGNYRFYNVPAGNSALFVSKRGYQSFNLANIYLGVGRMNEIHAKLELGAVSETITVSAGAVSLNTSSVMLSSALSKQSSEAEGKGFGDFFEYKIKQGVTINKNQSALVPILNAHIEAEKVTLWSPVNSDDDSDSDHHPAALRALWIHNTSGLTLDSGTFNILEKDTFAGEGILEPIHPGERRLLSYAADTAVYVTTEDEDSQRPVTRVRIAKGLMITTREERESRVYKIRNADNTPRQVVVEHPAKEGWTLVGGGPKAEESTASFHRFRINVAPDSTAEIKVEASHPLESSLALTNLNEQEVALLTDEQRLTPAMQEAFSRVLGKKNDIAGLDGQLRLCKQERDLINADQARLRENMKALKGSAEEKALLQRYTRQLDQEEDRLAALETEVSDLTTKKQNASQDLDQTIQSMVLDENF